MDIQKEREAFKKEFGIDDADTFPAFSGGIESSAVLKCNWLGWKKRAELEYKENPETIEIDGLKTIHKLCKFANDQNMEGCTFTEIVERMFSKIEQMKNQVNTLDEMLLSQGEALAEAKSQAVPETQQALNDRLLVKSIREHVESHIAEISVNDLFDKGWLAAMKCIQNNIDMLEAQEPAND